MDQFISNINLLIAFPLANIAIILIRTLIPQNTYADTDADWSISYITVKQNSNSVDCTMF